MLVDFTVSRDRSLVERMQKGDWAAFAEHYQAHHAAFTGRPLAGTENRRTLQVLADAPGLSAKKPVNIFAMARAAPASNRGMATSSPSLTLPVAPPRK